MKLLLVDDEEVSLYSMEACLQEKGFQVVFAKSAKEALNELEKKENQFFAILLDRLMPDQNGLDFLKLIKAKEEWKEIPVIIQTALSNSKEVIEGFDAGAFYYLTKPYTKEILSAITLTAVENYLRFLRVREELSKGVSALRFMKSARFQIQTVHEANELAPLLANICPDPGRALIGLLEILNNAVEHGNLEIDYALKTKLHESDHYMMELDKRANLPEYRDRFVQIEMENTKQEVVFRIQDQGKGFDWQSYLSEPEMAKNAFKTHGRGIFMSVKLSFDDLLYEDGGRRAIITIRK